MRQKVIALIGSLLTACMAFSWWVGNDWGSIIFLGEFAYPTEEDS